MDALSWEEGGWGVGGGEEGEERCEEREREWGRWRRRRRRAGQRMGEEEIWCWRKKIFSAVACIMNEGALCLKLQPPRFTSRFAGQSGGLVIRRRAGAPALFILPMDAFTWHQPGLRPGGKTNNLVCVEVKRGWGGRELAGRSRKRRGRSGGEEGSVTIEQG